MTEDEKLIARVRARIGANPHLLHMVEISAIDAQKLCELADMGAACVKGGNSEPVFRVIYDDHGQRVVLHFKTHRGAARRYFALARRQGITHLSLRAPDGETLRYA